MGYRIRMSGIECNHAGCNLCDFGQVIYHIKALSSLSAKLES
jgi:hypothetical protein